jgi:HEAT repeat protein
VVVKVGRALYLFGSRAAWKLTGLRAAGRPLVRELGSPDEDIRTIAGMFLVKAGKSAEPLLTEALENRQNVPMVLSVLADIGDPDLEPQIQSFSADSDPEISRAAKEALRVLRLPSHASGSNR